MLDGDDALELFKETMSFAAAFIQTSTAMRSQMRNVKSIIEKAMMTVKLHIVNRHLNLETLQTLKDDAG